MRTGTHRSFFWPIILIGVGLIWLLANLGWIRDLSWGSLWRLWPLFMIAIGLDILIARRSPLIGAVIALGVIGVVILLVVFGSTLGFSSSSGILHDTLREPLSGAESAQIEIDFSVGRSMLSAMDGGSDLFLAEIDHLGELRYEVQGEAARALSLSESSVEVYLGRLDHNRGEDLRWEIELSKAIPLELDLRGGVGETELDLTGLQVEALSLDGGVGKVTLVLPDTGKRYTAVVDGDVGELLIEIEPGALLDLHATGAVGKVTIDVPGSGSVRLEASVGVGDIRIPGGFERQSAGGAFVGESGIWLRGVPAGASADIVIHFEGGVGALEIR